jgi:DNA-binding transcriptional LysR family regulator
LIPNRSDQEFLEMRSLNLDQLRTFLEVVAAGSFSAAARRLNLSQPAVSLHVHQLEDRFGVSLIERIGRHALATEPGRELAENARGIFRQCDFTDDAMKRFREGWLGRVHIGTTLTALMYELPPILRRLRTQYPGIDLVVTHMPTRDSVDNIGKNAIDLALVTLPVKSGRLRVTPLRSEMLVAIFPVGAKDIPDAVTPAYAANQPLVIEHARGAVHALIMRWLSGEMPLLKEPMPIGTIEVVKKGVASGLGMSIVPDVAVIEGGEDLVVRPLAPPVPCTLAMIEHRNKRTEPAVDIVRDALLGLKID